MRIPAMVGMCINGIIPLGLGIVMASIITGITIDITDIIIGSIDITSTKK